MALKLYTYPNNKNAFKALIAAEYNGVKIELPPTQVHFPPSRWTRQSRSHGSIS